jgi:hypothetical protein
MVEILCGCIEAPNRQVGTMEWLKDLSDRMVLWFLGMTSEFERELTPKGRFEQRLWREQRLRNLKGLAIRWQQRTDAQKQTHETGR